MLLASWNGDCNDHHTECASARFQRFHSCAELTPNLDDILYLDRCSAFNYGAPRYWASHIHTVSADGSAIYRYDFDGIECTLEEGEIKEPSWTQYTCPSTQESPRGYVRLSDKKEFIAHKVWNLPIMDSKSGAKVCEEVKRIVAEKSGVWVILIDCIPQDQGNYNVSVHGVTQSHKDDIQNELESLDLVQEMLGWCQTNASAQDASTIAFCSELELASAAAESAASDHGMSALDLVLVVLFGALVGILSGVLAFLGGRLQKLNASIRNANASSNDAVSAMNNNVVIDVSNRDIDQYAESAENVLIQEAH